MREVITVLGAGLAGSEAAWQCAQAGYPVRLIDMKPGKLSPAHHLQDFAELVCSNSLRSFKLDTASGVLKMELEHFHSLILDCAMKCSVPAGNALAVDREAFPAEVSKRLREHPLIEVVEEEVKNLKDLGDGWRIIATGPLTEGPLFASIQEFTGENNLYFFDAAAPLVEFDSINQKIAFFSSRYQEEGDYLNCPFTQEEYLQFYEALMQSEKVDVKGFEKKLLFTGCQPVEALAEEGVDTLRFGPLKPVGLVDPRTGQQPYAVVQLRKDNFTGSLWNMVGFQTRLKFPEQERVFRLIPGLENARFARFGVMHRNSFICSPKLLEGLFRSQKDPKLFFAGQMTGVEGYLESTASGLAAAYQLLKDMGHELDLTPFYGRQTLISSLAAFASESNAESFQPMKANFSLLAPMTREESKALRKKYQIFGRGRSVKRLLYGLRSAELIGYPSEKLVKKLKDLAYRISHLDSVSEKKGQE